MRAQPYQVVFKAQDLGNAIPLVDIETRQITVVSPPVTDLSAEPVGYDMVVTWSPNECVDGLSEAERALGVTRCTVGCRQPLLTGSLRCVKLASLRVWGMSWWEARPRWTTWAGWMTRGWVLG